MGVFFRVLPRLLKLLKQFRKLKLPPKPPLTMPPVKSGIKAGSVQIVDKAGNVIRSFTPKNVIKFTKIKDIKPPPAIKVTPTKGIEKIAEGVIKVTPTK